ncbi:cytochrome P450 [Amycolatopsis thermophila]|uniref:Cytochrome P450 n=1 Tax=Amycolatopsis thermophila TaxID=206084 RepID=A0ABU0F584_9PSEU|nr:cytochrome P450 [Amycolatopsis thermophila]MDQ0382706.1 cytochrome P450 [Amycolatopsis thermophila]
MSALNDEVNIYLTPGDPRRAEISQDPYPFYERLRAHDPVYRSDQALWLITSWDEASQFAKEERFSRDPLALTPPAARAQAWESLPLATRVFLSGMMFRDDPEHARLRRLVHKAFTPGRVRQSQASIEQTARDLLEPLRERETFDFVSEFAVHLPTQVICRVMGMSASTTEAFVRWTEGMLDIQEPGEHPESLLREADRKAQECLDAFTEIFAARRRQPTDDLISDLVAANAADDEPMTDEQLVGQCILLHTGGHETTAYVLANGVIAFDRFPKQRALVRSDPGLVPRAIEEILRYDSSGRQLYARTAVADVPIGDHVVPRGERVTAIIGAVNRDPRKFERPGVFDIMRPDAGRHLAFGAGPTFCAGAHLARAELETAFRLLSTEFPPLRVVDDEVAYIDTALKRAPERLTVAWDR